MKKKDYFSELKGLVLEDLKERRRSLSEELMKLRFRKSAGQLDTSHRLKEVRRKIAQTATLIREKAA